MRIFKRIGATALFIFLLVPALHAQVKLKKVKLEKGISFLVPRDWRPMDDLDFTQRYPSVRAPLAGYSDINREIGFSINISATQWPDADLEIAKSFFKAGLANLFDRIEWVSEGVKEVNGKKVVYFEFESRINGIRNKVGFQEPILKYNYIQYYVEKGRTLVFSFDCPRRMRTEWGDTARKMMESIKID